MHGTYIGVVSEIYAPLRIPYPSLLAPSLFILHIHHRLLSGFRPLIIYIFAAQLYIRNNNPPLHRTRRRPDLKEDLECERGH